MYLSSVFSRRMDSSPDGSVSISELADTLLLNWHNKSAGTHIYETPFYNESLRETASQ